MGSFFDSVGSALEDVLPLLARVAPTLATAVGGPLAGTAVQFLENALGLTPGAGAVAVSAALATATPDQLAALKKVDNDFAVQMKQLDISVEKLDYDDRANARLREATVKDSTPAVLAYVLTAGLFGIIAIMMFHEIPPNAVQPLNILLGSVGAAWLAMVSYFYGSSRGSQAKDAMLYASTPSGKAGNGPLAR